MAYVLTSLSGNLISAASAAYAPTNSADVSAIASAYQVVSSLGVKGSYATSINGKYISATHAFNAEFAKKVQTGAGSTETAYISSLVGIDSATCSAIASSYAESAASSKQDTLSFGYDDDKISSINGSALAGQGGGGGLVTAIGTSESGITSINNTGLVDTAALRSADYSSLYVQEPLYISSTGDSSYIGISGDVGGIDSATCSAIASSYAESAASGKQDTLTFDWDSDSAISSINGSALAGQGGGASITAVSYDTATHQSSIVTATGFGIVGSATNYPRISSVHLTDGQTRHLEANTLAPGAAQTASGKIPYTLLFSPAISMWTTADAATGIYSPLQYGTGAGLFMDSNNFKGYIKGNELFISNTAIGRAARLEVHQSRGSRLGLTGQNGSEKVNLTESELTIVNSALSTATLGRTKLVFQSPDSGTATFSHNYINLYDMAESATKTISSTSIDYWNGKADSSALSSYVPYSSLEYNTASAISGINGSALAAGSTYSAGEGIDITDDVISVEAPVDIVAGPGIVIDNPDGNTLRVSTDEDYETVLWEGDTQPIRTTPITINLSETVMNFELIRFEGLNSYAGVADALKFATTSPANSEMCFGNNLTVSNSSIIVEAAYATVSGSSLTLIGAGRGQSNSNGVMVFRTDRGPTLYKIVGIHRIANN